MSSKTIAQSLLWPAIWISLLLLSTPLKAADDDASRHSRSITFNKSEEPDQQSKDEQLELAGIDKLSVLDKQGFRPESTVMAAHIATVEYIDYGEISIYDTSTELISDFDLDGYYHRFSVAIDADTIYDTSYIYVRLYLSYEGGPWNYYASSDDYHIHGDSEMDTFIIETELADGYPPGYYDVRIELYDADTGHWLSTYGPYDDASLSALPLEDSYYDDPHHSVSYPVETQVVVAGHGGAMSWLILTLALLIISIRMLALQYGSTGNADQHR